MDWVESIHRAIRYMEDHLREELTIRDIAQQAALSPFYFQKGFAMLCGMTVGDYIRQRRLSVAGLEILTTDRKIIDIALEAGYDSPDSFTRAFYPFPWCDAHRSAKKRGRGALLRPAENQHHMGRWSRHGLQNHEERGVYGALPGKDLQV